MEIKKKIIKKTEGTQRVEAFSDGIFGFCMTLLVIDLQMPTFVGDMNSDVLPILMHHWPKFLIFVLSFLIIAILWVNHHHFFENFQFTDWKLLWYNNFLLFGVVLIPFGTDFIGEHPFIPLVVAIYSAIMLVVALGFLLMVRYVFFKSSLLAVDIGMEQRRSEFRHTFPAVILYALAVVFSFVQFEVSLFILVLVPALYFIPSVLHMEEGIVGEVE